MLKSIEKRGYKAQKVPEENKKRRRMTKTTKCQKTSTAQVPQDVVKLPKKKIIVYF